MDLAQVEPIVISAILRLCPFNHTQQDDLRAQVMEELARTGDRFDPTVAKLTTFANMIAQRRFRDMLRAQASQDRRVHHAHALGLVRHDEIRDWSDPSESESLLMDELDQLEPAAFARTVCESLEHQRLRQHGGRGVHRYSDVQAFAIARLQRRQRMTLRQMQSMLRRDKELRTSLRLPQVPSLRSLRRFTLISLPKSCLPHPAQGANRMEMAVKSEKAVKRRMGYEKQVAILAGISESTLRKRREEKRPIFPYVAHPDGLVRYDLEAVAQIIESRTVPAANNPGDPSKAA